MAQTKVEKWAAAVPGAVAVALHTNSPGDWVRVRNLVVAIESEASRAKTAATREERRRT